MTNPRYRPRDYCLEPELFGKRFELTWCEVEARENARLAAAQLQNRYAVLIRHLVRTKYKPLDHKPPKPNPLKIYAIAAGISYDRLMKMLRGDVIMRVEDLGMAHYLLKLDIGLDQLGTRPPARHMPRTIK
jgi:hypothetical protein